MASGKLIETDGGAFDVWRARTPRTSMLASCRRLRERVEETSAFVGNHGDGQVRRAVWRCVVDAEALIDTADRLLRTG